MADPLRVRILASLAIVLAIVAGVTVILDGRLAKGALSGTARERADASLAVVRSLYDSRVESVGIAIRDLARSLSVKVRGERDRGVLVTELAAAQRMLELDVIEVADQDGRVLGRTGIPLSRIDPSGALDQRISSQLVRSEDGRWVHVSLSRDATLGGGALIVIGGFVFDDALAYQLRSVGQDDVLLVVDGTLVGSTLPWAGGSAPAMSVPEVLPAIAEVFHVEGRERLVAYGPVAARAGTTGVRGAIGVALPDPVASLDRSLTRNRFIILIGIAAVLMILATLLFRWFSQPLSRLRAAAAGIAEGRPMEQVDVQGGADFGSLSRSLSAISTSLEEMRKAAEIRDRFVAEAAHELRNPLAAIVGLAEALSTDRERMTPEDQERCLVAIARGGHTLQSLAGSLLDLSQIDRGTLHVAGEPVRLARFARSILAATQPPAGCSVTLQIPRGTVVLADRVRLEQVLTNLLVNAYRHGGPAVTIEAATEDGEVTIAVSDDGPGVPRDQQERIFDAFVQAGQADAHGAGIGLALVRGLVGAMHGRIWYEDGHGGARFVLTLPSVEQPRSALTEEGEERRTRAGLR